MGQVDIICVSKKGQVVLPKKVRDDLNINSGSKLLLVEKKGRITLSKIDSLIQKEDIDKGHFFPLLA